MAWSGWRPENVSTSDHLISPGMSRVGEDAWTCFHFRQSNVVWKELVLWWSFQARTEGWSTSFLRTMQHLVQNTGADKYLSCDCQGPGFSEAESPSMCPPVEFQQVEGSTGLVRKLNANAKACARGSQWPSHAFILEDFSNPLMYKSTEEDVMQRPKPEPKWGPKAHVSGSKTSTDRDKRRAWEEAASLRQGPSRSVEGGPEHAFITENSTSFILYRSLEEWAMQGPKDRACFFRGINIRNSLFIRGPKAKDAAPACRPEHKISIEGPSQGEGLDNRTILVM